MASKLEVYRKANSMMAMWRDDCRCGMCGCTADESDHVFGRGREYLLVMEHWMLRMSLCQPCHYKKHHGGGFDKFKQVERLKQANEAFKGERLETCYFILKRYIVARMFDDTEAAIDFIETWEVANGEAIRQNRCQSKRDSGCPSQEQSCG